MTGKANSAVRARIERALDVIAMAIEDSPGNMILRPVFERLEDELAKLEAQSPRQRAKALFGG